MTLKSRIAPVMAAALTWSSFSGSLVWAAPTGGAFYSEGVQLYQSGRYGEAIDSFDAAVKHRDHPSDAQSYIDRIRKETVDRIRNRALTGVNKANWQTKYYFMNVVTGRIHVGISAQEVFERGSTNFRPGAVEALGQLAAAINKGDNAKVEIDLINELNQDTSVAADSALIAQQLTAVFSYLSLSARGHVPKVAASEHY